MCAFCEKTPHDVIISSSTSRLKSVLSVPPLASAGIAKSTPGVRSRVGDALQGGAGSRDGLPSTQCTSNSRWKCVLPYAVALILTAPFYICMTYPEWYIDEMFAIVRNPDVRSDSLLWNIVSNDFWGQSLWPADGSGNWTHNGGRIRIFEKPHSNVSFVHILIISVTFDLVNTVC